MIKAAHARAMTDRDQVDAVTPRTETAARASKSTNGAGASVALLGARPGSALAEFERMYRANVDAVMAYFSRRCSEPQVVADLTSETFVQAAGTFSSFD